jgi:putative SOS response-associated peptidase YedK
MCARFEFKQYDDELQEEFEKLVAKLIKRYESSETLYKENISPTDKVRVITYDRNDDVFLLQIVKWGIKSTVFDENKQSKGIDPYFEKDIFNSRIETISQKGSKWLDYMKDTRCIFPMTAFYEWTGEKGKRVPQRITIDDVKIFFAGGVLAKGLDNNEGGSIITCEPNEFMKPIHNRMPVLFQIRDAGEFLRAQLDAALSICVPFDDSVKMSFAPAVLRKNAPQEDLFS